MDSSPTIKDNNIYLGSSNGLYIIDADTGKSSNFIFKNLKLQGINGESSQLSSPCVNDNDIFYCYNEGYYPKTSSLIKYNIQNKTSIKLFELSPTTISSPTFVQNSIIINNSEKLVRFDITKLSNSWIFNFPKSNYAYPFSFDASPIVSQNSVFAVGSSSLFSIDLNSGKENWRFESGILTSPVYYDNVVYASSLNKLIALDSKKGDLKWSITIKNNGWSLEPSVIIINSEGKVFHSGVSGEKH